MKIKHKETKEKLDPWGARDDVCFSPQVLNCCSKALEKAIGESTKPIFTNSKLMCPHCKNNKNSLGIFCDNCGQLVEWPDEITKYFLLEK